MRNLVTNPVVPAHFADPMVCIRKDYMILRLRRSKIHNYLVAGWKHTTKNAWRRFWKENIRLENNQKIFDQYDFSTKQKKNFVNVEDGKTYAYIHRGDSFTEYKVKKDASEDEKKSTLEKIFDKYYINPNEDKQSILMKVFGSILSFFSGKRNRKSNDLKDEFETKQIDIPRYQKIKISNQDLLKDQVQPVE